MKLHVEGIVKEYRRRKVVDDVSFHVNQGRLWDFSVQTGPAKPPPSTPSWAWSSPMRDPCSSTAKTLPAFPCTSVRKGIGYLAQEASVFRKMTVEDNIAAVFEWRGFAKKEITERTEALLTEFGLQKIRKTRGDLLSGGSAAARKLRAPRFRPAFHSPGRAFCRRRSYRR